MLDVTCDASVERAVREVLGATGRIDVLVNNAGIARCYPRYGDSATDSS